MSGVREGGRGGVREGGRGGREGGRELHHRSHRAKNTEERRDEFEELSGFLCVVRSLYMDDSLSGSVRLQLASTLCAYLTNAAECAESLSLCVRKRKKSGQLSSFSLHLSPPSLPPLPLPPSLISPPLSLSLSLPPHPPLPPSSLLSEFLDSSPEGISIQDALLMMVDDPDHAVRMHMAKVVTSLHYVAGSNELVSREKQLQIFQQVLNMLKEAHLISVSEPEY